LELRGLSGALFFFVSQFFGVAPSYLVKGMALLLLLLALLSCHAWAKDTVAETCSALSWPPLTQPASVGEAWVFRLPSLPAAVRRVALELHFPVALASASGGCTVHNNSVACVPLPSSTTSIVVHFALTGAPATASIVLVRLKFTLEPGHETLCLHSLVVQAPLLEERAYGDYPECKGPRTTFHASDDAQRYVAVQNQHEAFCIVRAMVEAKQINPMHKHLVRDAWELAHQLATWVNHAVTNKPTATHPRYKLKFVYSPNSKDLLEACLTARAGGYVTGMGEPLCRLLLEVLGMQGRTATFFTSLLDFGLKTDPDGLNYFAKWRHAATTEALVADFGFRQFVDFIHRWNTHYVYNPNVDRYGNMIETDLGHLPAGYYGISGGGGSGVSFEIGCRDLQRGTETTLISGGGGGGAGMSSPEHGTPVQAGGGGGGGVQLGMTGLPRIGAGMGNNPWGKLDVQSDVDPQAFAVGMKQAIADLRACAANTSSSVFLRGGGGAGGGAEVYARWNVTDPSAQPGNELHTVSLGYGFQFALGDDVLITPNAGSTELPVLICPFGISTVPVERCIEGGASGTPNVDPTPEEASAILACGTDLASRICALATYEVDNITFHYGSFTHINECNCPVSKLYYQEWLPDTPQWNQTRNRVCVYDNSSLTAPLLTEAELRAHPAWCVQVAGCKPFSVCDGAPEVAYAVMQSTLEIAVTGAGLLNASIPLLKSLVCAPLKAALVLRLVGNPAFPDASIPPFAVDLTCDLDYVDQRPVCQPLDPNCRTLQVTFEWVCNDSNIVPYGTLANEALRFATLQTQVAFLLAGVELRSGGWATATAWTDSRGFIGVVGDLSIAAPVPVCRDVPTECLCKQTEEACYFSASRHCVANEHPPVPPFPAPTLDPLCATTDPSTTDLGPDWSVPEGTPCVFPVLYRGGVYEAGACIGVPSPDDIQVPWCYTTANHSDYSSCACDASPPVRAVTDRATLCPDKPPHGCSTASHAECIFWWGCRIVGGACKAK
jgi:hypothetical protein